MAKQQGFTLIELVVVIVILGILAATALPKFVDLSGDARQAAVEGVAGGFSSTSSINYATCAARGVTGTGCVRLNVATSCTSIAANVIGWDTTKYNIKTDSDCATGTPVSGTTKSCVIEDKTDTTKTASATVICTG